MKMDGVEISAACGSLREFGKALVKNEFRGRCECGAEVAAGEQEIENAGHGETPSGHVLIPPFISVRKWQEEAERAAERLSGIKDFVHYQLERASLALGRRSVSDMMMASSASTSAHVECPRCRRGHDVALRFEATAEFPEEEPDPWKAWKRMGLDLENEETRLVTERFAFKNGFGTARGLVEALRGWEAEEERIVGPLARMREALDELGEVRADLPALADLRTAFDVVEERARPAVEWAAREWLFKLSDAVEATLAGAAQGGLLRGGWTMPEELRERIFRIHSPASAPPEKPGEALVDPTRRR